MWISTGMFVETFKIFPLRYGLLILPCTQLGCVKLEGSPRHWLFDDCSAHILPVLSTALLVGTLLKNASQAAFQMHLITIQKLKASYPGNKPDPV
jgi:hypothetical protein